MAFDASKYLAGKQRVLAELVKVANAARRAGSAQIEVEAKQLAEAIKAAAPERSGTLKSTVVAVKVSETRWEVRAGGPATTKKVRNDVKEKDFAEALVTGGNHGEFDYARGVEFGHRDGKGHVPAEPFFWPTYRRRRGGIRKRIVDRGLKAVANDNKT